MNKKISIDKEKCIGCGICVSFCPNVFEIKDGRSSVKDDFSDEDLECAKKAEASCPMEAISVDEV